MKYIALVVWVITGGAIGYAIGHIISDVLLGAYEKTGQTILASEVVEFTILPYVCVVIGGCIPIYFHKRSN